MSEPSATPAPGRQDMAAELLHEAVIASRGESSPFAGAASCGLGDGPELDFQLTDKARALIEQLWPAGLGASQVGALRDAMERWVERQDGLDRKRNHFMKDFRNTHGYDRSTYGDEQRAEWESGLEAIYGDATARREADAQELLAVMDSAADAG